MNNPFRSHKYKYIPDYTAHNTAAERMRLQWRRYMDAYNPLAYKMTNQLNQGGQADIDQARTTAENMQTNAADAMTRKISEYGMQLSPMQRQALATKLAANKGLAGITASNTERRAVNERDSLVREGLVNIGTGVRNMANQSVSQAAQLEAERNATGYGIAAQKTANSAAKAQAAFGLTGQAAGTAATLAILS